MATSPKPSMCPRAMMSLMDKPHCHFPSTNLIHKANHVPSCSPKASHIPSCIPKANYTLTSPSPTIALQLVMSPGPLSPMV